MLFRPTSSYRKRWRAILSSSYRHWRRVLLFLALLYTSLLYNERKHPFTSHPHTITTALIEFEQYHLSNPTNEHAKHSFLPREDAAALCTAVRFKPWASPHPPRKIYDLFLLNTELDWLEIRLRTLAASVDYFVIVESPITFTGQPKPLILQENWERFRDFHAQIIHHVLENPPRDAKRTWDIEDFQRNAMFVQVIPGLGGAQKARWGDVLVVSDVDEIPRPVTMMVLRHCDVPARVTIRSRFYYYGFQWRHRGEEWAHGQATMYAGEKGTVLPADLRNGEGGWNRLGNWWQKSDLWNAGWHCSTCFETVQEVLGKMGAFSHTSLNQEKFRDEKGIVERVRAGKDLWDREAEMYDRVDGNQDIPQPLKKDEERWAYLLNRDGHNAGFTDYKVDVEASG